MPPAGSAQNRHYVSAAGAVIAVIVTEGALPALGASQTAPNYVATIAAAKLQYWHRDHLGSTIATTDHAGAVTARYAYDPFGRRRHTDGSEDAAGSLVVDWAPGAAAGTDCGYIGHEHLDDAGVVHMNGRIYDPLIARFMQADPLVQNPANLQGYDRYAYCYNSPLVCTDPSGYASLSKLWKKIRPFVAIAVAIYLGPGGMAWGAESMFAIRRKRRITAACH